MAHRDDHDDGSHAARVRRAIGLSQEEFFACCWPWLLRVLISQGDSALAEEAAQETVVAALDNWDDLITFERPDSWLYKVATRRLRRLEAQARRQGHLDEDPAGIEADLRQVAASDGWVAQELDLLNAIRLLPRRQGEVVALRILGEFTEQDTADILGVTEGTVKTQLSRARKKLRVLLEVRDPS